MVKKKQFEEVPEEEYTSEESYLVSKIGEKFDFNFWVQEQFKKTPYWAIAIAIHLLFIAIAMAVTVEKRGFSDKGAISIEMPPPDSRDKIEEIEIADVIPDFHPEAIEQLEFNPSEKVEEVLSIEPPILRNIPVKEALRNEANTNDPIHHSILGDSFEFMSQSPMKGKGPQKGQGGEGEGELDVIGVGGGAGGATGGLFGGRFGGKEDTIARAGGDPTASEAAVLAALRWLARHQNDNGSWDADTFNKHCVKTICIGPGLKQHKVGVTALALLAYLGAGYTHQSRWTYEDPISKKKIKVGDVVRKAISWLKKTQDNEGCFSPRKGHYMYDHAIASLAMAEAYGLTKSLIFKDSAQRGIDFLLAAQNPYKAWRYTKKPGDNDTSVTGWCLQALKSAKFSGLFVDLAGFSGALSWLKDVTDPEFYIVAYDGAGSTGKVYIDGINEAYEGHPALTAVGVLIRMFVEEGLDKVDPQSLKIYKEQAKLITEDLPKYEKKIENNPIDYYYWYYATLALYLLRDAPGKQYVEYWKKWHKKMLRALIKSQRQKEDGCAWGSWDHESRWGMIGGRVYTTAINCLTLEVYYRYRSVFAQKRK